MRYGHLSGQEYFMGPKGTNPKKGTSSPYYLPSYLRVIGTFCPHTILATGLIYAMRILTLNGILGTRKGKILCRCANYFSYFFKMTYFVRTLCISCTLSVAVERTTDPDDKMSSPTGRDHVNGKTKRTPLKGLYFFMSKCFQSRKTTLNTRDLDLVPSLSGLVRDRHCRGKDQG